jgi:Kdo2-lipid IVA lauroyltransferase/acyltransferase
MRWTKRIRRSAVYHLCCVLVFVFNLLPRKLARFVGGWLALTGWSLVTRDQHKVHRHLTLAYGNRLTDNQKRVIGRDFYINTGRCLVDVMRCRRHYRREVMPHVTITGRRNLDAAFDLGHGVVCITGHIGAFELLAVHMATLGYPVAVIARQLYQSRLDRLLIDHRTSMGIVNFSTTDDPARLAAWLRSGGLLGVLIDTDSPRVRGIHVSMFGRPAYTPVGPTLLAMRAGSPIVCMACLHTPEGAYHIDICSPISTAKSGHASDRMRQVTQECITRLERYIERDLSQWIWLHNRWHTRTKEFA